MSVEGNGMEVTYTGTVDKDGSMAGSVNYGDTMVGPVHRHEEKDIGRTFRCADDTSGARVIARRCAVMTMRRSTRSWTGPLVTLRADRRRARHRLRDRLLVHSRRREAVADACTRSRAACSGAPPTTAASVPRRSASRSTS